MFLTISKQDASTGYLKYSRDVNTVRVCFIRLFSKRLHGTCGRSGKIWVPGRSIKVNTSVMQLDMRGLQLLDSIPMLYREKPRSTVRCFWAALIILLSNGSNTDIPCEDVSGLYQTMMCLSFFNTRRPAPNLE